MRGRRMKSARVGPLPKPRLERHEQADGVKLLRSLGAAVYVLGTVRRKGDYQGTMQTPGIADVEAWLPIARYTTAAPRQRRLLKWEVKRALVGRLSPAQIEYRDICFTAGADYVCGDLTALMTWLVDHGYLRADQLPYDRQPKETR